MAELLRKLGWPVIGAFVAGFLMCCLVLRECGAGHYGPIRSLESEKFKKISIPLRKAYAASRMRSTQEPQPSSAHRDDVLSSTPTASGDPYFRDSEDSRGPLASTAPPPLQATIALRKATRTVANMDMVTRMVEAAFLDMPVETLEFSNLPFFSQVETMQKSAFFLTMHGATMSNLIFMRKGTSLIELFPYKFEYENYRRLALRFGLKYFAWSNTHVEASSYYDNCLAKGDFNELTEPECHRLRVCRFCVRDHAATTVNMTELSFTLAEASVRVAKWRRARSS